jgi:hypothetical protein
MFLSRRTKQYSGKYALFAWPSQNASVIGVSRLLIAIAGPAFGGLKLIGVY